MIDAHRARHALSRSSLVAFLLALALAAATAALGLAQVRGWSGVTNADGVSYLDLASRFLAGDWRAAGNGYWSPLYPMLLAGARALARLLPGPPPGELVVVFTMNVVVLAAAALAFARLAFLLLAPPSRSAPAVVAARVAAAAAIGLWSLIRFVGATTITPDGLLAAILFLVAAELVVAWRAGPGARRDLRMGMLVAAGYWTKAVFFPVAIVAILVYMTVTGRVARRLAARRGERSTRRLVLPRVLVTALVLALPLVMLQSWTQGRPSFGETGRLNYRWYVGGLPRGAPVTEPAEATRRRDRPAVVALSSVPGAVLFTGDLPGAFPYWFDPSRYEPPGIGPLSRDAQWRAIRFNLPWYRATGATLFAAAVAAAVGAAIGGGERRWGRLWCTLPAVAVLVLYTMTHVEGRMGAAPLACLLLALVALHDAAPRTGRRLGITLECVALVALAVVALGRTSNRIPPARTTALRDAGVLPRAMRAAGLRAGDAVGVGGEPYGLRWAHETGARIIAVIPPAALTDSSLAAVARESAVRGQPLSAVLLPPHVTSPARTVVLPGGWRLWRATHADASGEGLTNDGRSR